MVTIGLIILVMSVCLNACQFFGKPRYQSQYTPEEHVQKLTQITEKRYAHLIESGELVDVRVEILHAFYDDAPEFFLITLEFLNEWKCICPLLATETQSGEYFTKYMHTIGRIKNDEYIIGLSGYGGALGLNTLYVLDGGEIIPAGKTIYMEAWWRNGRAAYDLCSVDYSRKYYAGGACQAVKTKEGIMRLVASPCRGCQGLEIHFEDQLNLILESTYRRLMKSNKTMFDKLYDYEKEYHWDSYPVCSEDDLRLGLKYLQISEEKKN